MTGTTERVMVKELNRNLDPNQKSFEINDSGRTHALKYNLEDNEYRLFIFYKNNFNKGDFKYESLILEYFYSSKLNKLLFIKTHKFVASDQSYVRLSDGKIVSEDEATDEEGNLKDGYTTEAMYYEDQIGGTIADNEEKAVKRKLNI